MSMHYSRSPYRGGSVIRASSTYRETSPLRALSPLRSLSVDRYVDRVMDDLDVRRAYNRAMSPVRTTTYSYDVLPSYTTSYRPYYYYWRYTSPYSSYVSTLPRYYRYPYYSSYYPSVNRSIWYTRPYSSYYNYY